MTRAARNNRGGVRQGTPGQSYANRTDLNQPIRTAPGQPYGMAQQQRQAQQAIPLPATPAPGAAAPAPGGPTSQPPGAGAQPPSVQPGVTDAIPPGGLGPLNAPTNRPGEPLTAGLSTGPGPGPEALGQTAPQDPTLATLKGILAQYPNADLQALVAQAARRLGQ